MITFTLLWERQNYRRKEIGGGLGLGVEENIVNKEVAWGNLGSDGSMVVDTSLCTYKIQQKCPLENANFHYT